MLLRSISIVDFSFGFCVLFFTILEFISPLNHHNQNAICMIYFVLTAVCPIGNSHLIVAMGSERLYAVFRPISYRENVTISTNKKVTCVCFLLALVMPLLSAPLYSNETGFCYSVRPGVNEALFLIHVFSWQIFVVYMPSFLILVMNTILILKLKRRQKDTAK